MSGLLRRNLRCRLVLGIIAKNVKIFSMHKSPSAANNTGSFEKAKLFQNSETQKEAQDESNRHSEKNRRSRARGHTKRNSPNAPDQDGRPLTENIDTGYGVLHGCGIRIEPVHREVNTAKQPLDFFVRRLDMFHIASYAFKRMVSNASERTSEI